MSEQTKLETELLHREVEAAAKAQHDNDSNAEGSWDDQPDSYKARMRRAVLPVVVAVIKVRNNATPPVDICDEITLLTFDDVVTALNFSVSVIDYDLSRETFDKDLIHEVQKIRDLAVNVRDIRREALAQQSSPRDDMATDSETTKITYAFRAEGTLERCQAWIEANPEATHEQLTAYAFSVSEDWSANSVSEAVNAFFPKDVFVQRQREHRDELWRERSSATMADNEWDDAFPTT